MGQIDDRIQFDDLQFGLQLELEERASDDALRDLGRTMKEQADRIQCAPNARVDLAIRVFLGLRHIPGLDSIAVEARFTIWCEAFEITPKDCFDAIARILQAKSNDGL